VTYRVVTTMNAKGWRETGARMVESFRRHWPADAQPLILYAEGFAPEDVGVEIRRLPKWLDEFKETFGSDPACRGQRKGGYDYRFDAIKFSHKVAALTDIGLELDTGALIWLDADIFTHADVTTQWLDGLFATNAYIAWLDRKSSHPECGFVMFRCSQPYHRDFMYAYRRLYEDGGVFRLPETHDSFALQHLVNLKVAMRKIPPPVSLSTYARHTSHPAANGPLSACIDHLKGARKTIGRTPKAHRIIRDGNPYWT
jgi:hypothetical protein